MHTLALSGWAQPHDALHPVAPDGTLHLDYSACRSVEETLALLDGHTPKLAIGWSLGGWLLMRAVEEKILRPERLLLIAPTFQFIADAAFPWAMGGETYRLFTHSYCNDPVRTAARFAGLIAKGDREEKEVRKRGYWEHSADAARWMFWLKALEESKAHHFSFGGFPPTLLLHGERDAVVPVEQSRRLQERIPDATLHVFPEAGHAPHWHDAKTVREMVAG